MRLSASKAKKNKRSIHDISDLILIGSLMSDSDSQVLECETDSEPDEVGEADEGPDQYRHWVHTTYGYYPPDQKDSKLVRAARVGNLPSVMALLENCDLIDRAKVINAARKWTEVQVKIAGFLIISAPTLSLGPVGF